MLIKQVCVYIGDDNSAGEVLYTNIDETLVNYIDYWIVK